MRDDFYCSSDIVNNNYDVIMDNITIVVVNRKCRLGHIRERRFAITLHISTAMTQSIHSYIYITRPADFH